MAENFIEMRKQFVKMSSLQLFSETGSRIMHIALVDGENVPCLAVVGTEVNPRQMSFSVTEEFVKFVGLDQSDYTGRRWTTKSEVYSWLQNFLMDPSSEPGGDCIRSGPETYLNADMIRKGNVGVQEASASALARTLLLIK